MWFELVDTAPSALLSAAARARYDATTHIVDLDGYMLDAADNKSLFAAAQLTLDADSGRFLLSSTTVKSMPVKPADYVGGESAMGIGFILWWVLVMS